MSGCIIQCQQWLGQQEDGHRITGRPAWNNNPCACPSKMQRPEVTHWQKQLFFSAWLWWHIMQQIETWSQSTELQFKRGKKILKMVSDPCRVTLKFCWTDPVTAHASGLNILFLLLSCSINSLENWVKPRSVLRLLQSPAFTQSLHRSLRSQRGLPWDVNHAGN